MALDVEFVEKVAHMRHLQKDAEKTRNSILIKNAEIAGKEVDLLLAAMNINKVDNPQTTLF